MNYVRQEITEFTYSNIVSTILAWNNNILTAGSFIVGQTYRIVTLGTTNFTLIGASTNTIGVSFTATGAGAGTGTAQTAYLLGDLVRVGNYHYKSLYGSLTTPNVAKDPLTNQGTAWYKYEVSNIYACLDEFSETKTTWTANGIVEFTRGGKEVIGIGNFTATQVKIEYLDISAVVIATQTYNFSTNGDVYDAWDYGYAGFSSTLSNVLYYPLLRKGVKIRVTFSRSGLATDCGFMIAGKTVYMGDTLDDVNFPDKRIGSQTVSVADFGTIVLQKDLIRKIADAKVLVNVPMMFVIDPSTSSTHQNLVILGKITQCSGTANNFDKNEIRWQIEQTIIT